MLNNALTLLEIKNNKFTIDSLKVINFCYKLCINVHALIIGFNPFILKNLNYVSKILLLNNNEYKKDIIGFSSVVCSLAFEYDIIITSTKSIYHDVLCRVSGLFDKPLLSNVCGIISDNIYVRSSYSGNILQTVKYDCNLKFISIRSSSFNSSVYISKVLVKFKIIYFRYFNKNVKILSNKFYFNTGLPNFDEAKIIIAGGKSFGSSDNFMNFLYPLAIKLKAAIGATRSAVEAGYVSNDWQLGQTGKCVSPDIYIAFGISGADQHMIGVKDSKKIICVNMDTKAPITNLSDYIIIGNMFDIIPKFINLMDSY